MKKQLFTKEEVDKELEDTRVLTELLSTVKSTASDVLIIKGQLSRDYATKEWVNQEYAQTKKVLNYVIMLIGTAFVLAVIGLVIIK